MNAPLSITVLALLLLAAVACAQFAPTPEPFPTATLDIPATVAAQVTELMAAIPTTTPYPTATPAPTYTPNPTATPLPTYTPYPTPTAAHTATPYPTYTPYPPLNLAPTPTNPPQPTVMETAIRWKLVSPRDYYSLEVPADWYLENDEPETRDFQGRVDYGVDTAGVYIHDAYSSSGWNYDFTVEKMVEQDLEFARETWPGLRVLSVVPSSFGEHRTESSFPGSADSCAGLLYGRHILTPSYSYTLWVEVCDGQNEFYDIEFADRLLSSFTYW